MRVLLFGSTGAVFLGRRLIAAAEARGLEIVPVGGESQLLAAIDKEPPALIVIQSEVGNPSLLDFVRAVRLRDDRIPLVVLLDRLTDQIVLAAMRAGVNDILTDGSRDAEIAEALDRLPRIDRPPAGEVTPLVAGNRLVGHTRSLEQLRRAIQRVAMCDSNVLITGETGTGKELAAQLVHCNSRRRSHRLISVNCAAIPDGLLESELFGFERGAFTGAHVAREGTLQHADGGTLFLDEIGDMSLYAQAKILRVIENRKVQRLGASREVPVNIRIIAATNQNLEQLTAQQRFRQDLYFRLDVARLHLAPLREHAADIPELVDHMIGDLCTRLERPVKSVDPTFIAALRAYHWPGNVRELRNVVESTLVFCTSSRITRRDLPSHLRTLLASEKRKRETEREKIAAALLSTGWNRSRAARLLGCSRMTLYRKMVKYDLFSKSEGVTAERDTA